MYIVGIMSKNRKKKYFISFIEEFWRGQLPNTWIGRVEVYVKGGEKTEIALFSHDSEEVEALIEKWDFKDYNLSEFTDFLIELQGVKYGDRGKRYKYGEEVRDDA